MNGASSWTSPKKGRLFELRQDHYTASINVPVFMLHVPLDSIIESVIEGGVRGVRIPQ